MLTSPPFQFFSPAKGVHFVGLFSDTNPFAYCAGARRHKDLFANPFAMAVAGAADAGRHLVAYQLAATGGKERRTAHQTCALLLVAFDRGHLTRRLFGSMLRRIAALPSPPG
jgi:hypothetical protein